MADESGTSSNVISLPEGGGSLSGIGESFSPDLFTGTGNFSVPISVPSGRGEFGPELKLAYSTGTGNGPFGMGWSISVPGVTRKTNEGVPAYQGDDTFVLSGSEDLVEVSSSAETTTYQPRTEGLYARIEHHTPSGGGDFWKVVTTSGKTSYYGDPDGSSKGRIADPDDPSKIYQWKLLATEDPFGNRIEYSYTTFAEGNQLYLDEIQYVDYDDSGTQEYLAAVVFEYESRPDPSSTHRPGFELRTTRRCSRIRVESRGASTQDVRHYDLNYLPDGTLHNNASMLKKVTVTGVDGQETQSLPPLEFEYGDFEPEIRSFDSIDSNTLPGRSLADPSLQTVDLFGNGLPDLVEAGAGPGIQYWRNEGDGEFSYPRPMDESPAGLNLADPDVQFIDAEGNGRADLLVDKPPLQGYFPLTFDGEWDENSFVSYKEFPTVDLSDPNVVMMDLTGDGLTDIVQAGQFAVGFLNDSDPSKAWQETTRIRFDGDKAPDPLDFSSPRLRRADMSGDGLQDIVLIHRGRIDYWPNKGHGRFGARVTMTSAPRFPRRYAPSRVLLGDVDGSGPSDVIFVGDNKVTVSINQAGNSFADPVEIKGTPRVADEDSIQLMDLYGTGVPGLLYSGTGARAGDSGMYFLDLTGGQKPYLLEEMDNHMGSVTRVDYRPSTEHYLRDRRTDLDWETALPFPVQTVTTVEVVDQISDTKMTTEYDYHHGYWDGHEREFRGFARVDQRDTETFADYDSAGLFPDQDVDSVPQEDFSPPTESRQWFMLGGIREPDGDWSVPDFADEYWGHADQSTHPKEMLGDWVYDGDGTDPAQSGKTLDQKLDALGGFDKRRQALRALRGQPLRSEVYANDGSSREDSPYTVTEHALSFRHDGSGPAGDETLEIIFPYRLATRTTQWERGDDPRTTFTFQDDFDGYGQSTGKAQVACPRGWANPAPDSGDAVSEPYLSTLSSKSYIHEDTTDQYMVDRVEETQTWELVDDGSLTVKQLKEEIDTAGTHAAASREMQGHAVHYYDGPAYQGNSKGQIGDYGAKTRTQQLVLTDALVDEAYPSDADPPDDTGAPLYLEADAGSRSWTSEYPDAFRSRLDTLNGRAGYTYDSTEGRYYVEADRKRHDFQDSNVSTTKGLVTGRKDPLGHETEIQWDTTYSFLPAQVTDPAGMTRQADYEMRTFKPKEVTDPNGNRIKVDYTPLGLIAKKARMGKASETRGDTLADPGRSFTYDFGAFDASGEPVSVKTTERVHHVNASYSPADPGETIETVEYSDGMGRTVQTRVQAEDLDFGEAGLTRSSVGDAIGSSPSSGPRVRVTGWTRYNNKGDVVEKWEPFFAEGFGFESVDPDEDDASITMHYDAKGRKVRTVRPDGGESRVVFGVPGTVASPDVTTPETVEPTPWEQYTYDANDNGGRTNISDVAESGFSGHFDTPTSVVQDARGRAIETTERNGPAASDWYTTETDYDIRGNVTKVTDTRGNVAAEQVFDLADQTIRTESIDAGHSTAVFDAAGTSIEARDAKGGLTLKAADDLLRPTKVWGRDTDGSSEDVRLVEETLYGDGPNGPSSPADTNHLGKPYRAYDEAGRVETAEYDFKGNVLETTRRVIDPQLMIDAYQAADSANNWAVDTYRVDWSRESGETRGDKEAELLKSQDYTTTKAYDGLDRSRQVTYPEDKNGSRKVLEPTYNKGGSLQAVDLDGSTYVEHIAYNPKGQRILAALGCGVMTRYDYDDESMRLVRLRSEGYTKPNSTTYAPDGTTPHQDFSYTYDGVGNVTQIDSAGNNVGIGGTNSLTRTFEYDPLYRLTEATGREYAANPSNPWDYMPAGGNANDPSQTRAYTESYDYDKVGNMTKLTHDYGAGSGTWTRDYVTESTTNRLDQMTSAGGTHQYSYDGAGNLTSENSDRKYEWDARGRMRSFRNQVSGSQATVFAHYTYDGGGQRVQKVVSKDSGKPVHSVYIGGIFEHHERIDGGTVDAEVNHLHVMDDQKRVAIERVGSELDGSNPPTTQYHLGDHLQSSNVVLDGTGTLFNREEYRPFGESSFGSYTTKRYRFTGQERDEESSLSYHGARYYAPWTAQWTSPDPKGMVDGTNLYTITENNPINYQDTNGKSKEKPEARTTEADITSAVEQAQAYTASAKEQGTSKAREKSGMFFAESLSLSLHLETGLESGEPKGLANYLEQGDLGNLRLRRPQTFEELSNTEPSNGDGYHVPGSFNPYTFDILLNITTYERTKNLISANESTSKLPRSDRLTLYEELHHAGQFDDFTRSTADSGSRPNDIGAELNQNLALLGYYLGERQYVKLMEDFEIEAKTFARAVVMAEQRARALETDPESTVAQKSDEEIKNAAEASAKDAYDEPKHIYRDAFRTEFREVMHSSFLGALPGWGYLPTPITPDSSLKPD